MKGERVSAQQTVTQSAARQKTQKQQDALELLKNAYVKLKECDIASACELLDKALGIDLENPEIPYALKCVQWWIEQTKKLETINEPSEKGVFIISQLKPYNVFLGQLKEDYDQCLYSVKYFVYSLALFFFKDLLVGSHRNQHDPSFLLLVGRCYKGIGNYDEALNYLEQAVRFKREDAETLAEVADINALLAETKAAKALFREAFFIDPSKIDLESLESALITHLRDKVAALGYSKEALCEWIPVYASLWGVFSVKRELKQVEAGRLKQSIFALETEYQANPSRQEILKPRLLNRYFWLIDHYENIKEASSLVEETLLKIEVTDRNIYQKYTGYNEPPRSEGRGIL